MRIAYFCKPGPLGYQPLQQLLQRGFDVCMIVCPLEGLGWEQKKVVKRVDSIFNRYQKLERNRFPDSPFGIAKRYRIPHYYVGDASSRKLQKLIKKNNISLIVVSTFNQLLKPALFELPSYGSINIHPSRLPTHYGPCPLFWTYFNHEMETGYSIHQIDSGEDTGALLYQQDVSVSFAMPARSLSEKMADEVASSLPDVIQEIAAGIVIPRPQATGFYQRARKPKRIDVLVDQAWTTERAYHFISGLCDMYPILMDVCGEPVQLTHAISYHLNEQLPAEHIIADDEIRIQFSDGYVRCLY